ncbi:hypothetical protein [Paenibacillus ihumii]|uniref:hypothetical protein n=1 Tax=Paenibacillus ihumii TaxID=687436 RepID=UPI0006D7E61E|nr:hypothetical protein [Paenibacillus ihumii]
MKICLYAVRNREGWQAGVSLDFAVDLSWWTEMGQKAVGVTRISTNSCDDWLLREEAELYECARARALTRQEIAAREAEVLLLLADKLPLGLAISFRDGFVHRADMDEWGAKEWGRYMKDELGRRLKAEKDRDRHFIEGLRPVRLIWTREKGMTPEGLEVKEELAVRGLQGRELEAERDAEQDAGRSGLGWQKLDLARELADTGEKYRQLLSKQIWDMAAIGQGASRLGDALAGRSLLAAELQQLLSLIHS